jgi:hypothetical protein
MVRRATEGSIAITSIYRKPEAWEVTGGVSLEPSRAVEIWSIVREEFLSSLLADQRRLDEQRRVH